MPDKWPLANGLWSNAANWNGGTKPVAGDDVFADGRTVTVDESFTVATIRTTQRSGGTNGGTFNFNTSGVIGNATSGLIVTTAGVVNITATSGTVTLNAPGTTLGGFITVGTTIITHSGNCDFVLIGTSFTGFTFFSTPVGIVPLISKTSTGTITITGNLIGGGNGGYITQHAFSSTAGNTIINGNVTGGVAPTCYGIVQTGGGSIVVNGNIFGGSSTNANAINQTGGPITINGNITGGTGTTSHAILTNSNLTVNGNVNGSASSTNTFAINQSAGILVVNGATNGSAGTAINFTGTNYTQTGNANGSTTGGALITSAPINNITGNVTAGTVAAITSSSANAVSVTGTVTASASAPAITSTNANGQVYLNGNMVNNNGKVAIYAPIVWLDKNNTTSAAFFTSGGVARTLYSANTVPNTPAANNVREGVVFGAGNSLTGTIEMPVAADVRNGVVYDNGTTGTALFTTSQLLTEINASSDAVAVRMQNLCTPMILGELMEAFKK